MADLSERVGDIRSSNVDLLCSTAEFVNQNATEIHGLLGDRRSTRADLKEQQREHLSKQRALIRADMERIVSSDFV